MGTAYHGSIVLAGAVALGITASAAQASVTFFTTQAAFDAATDTTLLENFATAPSKNHALASLTLHGVTYTSLATGASHNVYVAAPGFSNFGSHVGVTTDNIMTSSGVENILATFATPQAAIGFNAFFNGRGPGTLSVFGAGNSLLGSLTFADGMDPATGLADKGYLGFASSDLIYSFQWNTTQGNILNTGYTNISVGTITAPPPPPVDGVPEVDVWVLLIAGFGLTGAAQRRRRMRMVAA